VGLPYAYEFSDEPLGTGSRAGLGRSGCVDRDVVRKIVRNVREKRGRLFYLFSVACTTNWQGPSWLRLIGLDID